MLALCTVYAFVITGGGAGFRAGCFSRLFHVRGGALEAVTCGRLPRGRATGRDLKV